MTGQERDYEAVLSRVLRTTTDQLEPVGDGLTKIRARLSEPWLKRQWWLLRTELMVLRWLVVVRCESFFSKIRSRSDVTDLATNASAGREADGGPLKSLLSIATATPGKRPRRSAGPAMAWLRPALAVAGAVVLVVAGVFALGQLREGFILGLENATGTNSSTAGQQGGNGSPQGGGSAFPDSGPSRGRSAPSPGTSAGHNKTVPSPGPCVSASPPPVSSPSPASSPTAASPTPTPTSPSPTPTPTSPSPTPSTSNGPITSGIAGHTQEAIGTTALVTCEQTPAGAQGSPPNQGTGGP
jgi:hypothetical protein